MSKIQLIGKAIMPMVDDVTRLVTSPRSATRTLCPSLTDGPTFVNVTKLSDDIIAFIGESVEKLSKYKDSISDDLYEKLVNAIMSRNFKLKDIVLQHYSKLDDCKNLDDVAKMFPEIHLPDITPKKVLTQMVSEHLSKSKLLELQEFAKNGRFDKIDEFFESIVSPQLKATPKYEDVKILIKEIKEEIIAGKFQPTNIWYTPTAIGSGKGLNTVASLYNDNFEEVILEMLRRNYIKGENVSDIVVESAKGVKVTSGLLRKQDYKFPNMDKHFMSAIEKIDASSARVVASNIKTKPELISSALKKAWCAGSLKYDWKGAARHWKVLDSVWAKNAGRDFGVYSTDKLIDAYIFNAYTKNVRTTTCSNPYAKYIDGLPMNKKKQIGLEYLYSMARTKNMADFYKVKNSEDFIAFKKQFDIEGMAKSIEALEHHYQKAFLKMYWGHPERRTTFANALKQEFANIEESFELTDEILKQASDLMFV